MVTVALQAVAPVAIPEFTAADDPVVFLQVGEDSKVRLGGTVMDGTSGACCKVRSSWRGTFCDSMPALSPGSLKLEERHGLQGSSGKKITA